MALFFEGFWSLVCDSSEFRFAVCFRGTVHSRTEVIFTVGGEGKIQRPVQLCTPEFFGSTGAAESRSVFERGISGDIPFKDRLC